MKLTPCPKCRRKTWSAKWQSCTGCGYREGQATLAGALTTPAPRKKKAKAPFAKRNGNVTETVTSHEISDTDGDTVTKNVTPDEVCPTCHRKVPMTGAQRQKAYRERQRA